MTVIALTIKNLNLGGQIDMPLESPVQNYITEIYSQEEFHSILIREKSRSDRTGHGFSVISIEVSSALDIDTLAKHLKQLIRASDDIGWFDHKNLGIFLFNTSALGATQFLNKCREKTRDGFSSLQCSVYSYPDEWCNF